jgi:hypothetical protein
LVNQVRLILLKVTLFVRDELVVKLLEIPGGLSVRQIHYLVHPSYPPFAKGCVAEI